jgi:hypothetical protein
MFMEGEAKEHQKLFEWPLNKIGVAYSSFRAQIDFHGNFDHCGKECDIAVGLSDGHSVWGVGRGDKAIGLDVLRPFPDGQFRPCAGLFYDAFEKQGGRQSMWHASITFDKNQGVGLSLWNDGSPPPREQLFYSAANFSQPDGLGPHLKLVAYRDDPPQRYGVQSVQYMINYTQDTTQGVADAAVAVLAAAKSARASDFAGVTMRAGGPVHAPISAGAWAPSSNARAAGLVVVLLAVLLTVLLSAVVFVLRGGRRQGARRSVSNNSAGTREAIPSEEEGFEMITSARSGSFDDGEIRNDESHESPRDHEEISLDMVPRGD